MLCRKGMTLIEIIVVLIILGLALTFAMPNFTVPSEHAKAIVAQNNLLAIYSAQQNYYNNNGSVYCNTNVPNPEPSCAVALDQCAPDLAHINCNFSLNIPDDGTYLYSCPNATTCTAIRNNGSGKGLTLTLNQPVVTGGGNPSCNFTATGWCP